MSEQTLGMNLAGSGGIFGLQRATFLTLLSVLLLHLAALWMLQTGLRNPAIQPPQLREMVVSLIAPETPKQIVAATPARPSPVELKKQNTPQPVKMTPKPAVSETQTPAATAAPVVSQAASVVSPPAEPVAEPVITAPRFDAAYLSNPAPAYPVQSRRAGEYGKVLLRVFVSAEGLPAEITLRTGSGFPRLDEAAMLAVRNWRFVPAKQGDKNIAAWVQVPINFKSD